MPTPVHTALHLVETAVEAVVAGIQWSPGTPGTVERLLLPVGHANHLSVAYLAQHQDGGGQGAPLVHSAGWVGLVVVKALSSDRGRARTGLGTLVTAMGLLASPAGYALRGRWERPLALPTVRGIYTSAGLWRVTIRRTA